MDLKESFSLALRGSTSVYANGKKILTNRLTLRYKNIDLNSILDRSVDGGIVRVNNVCGQNDCSYSEIYY